MKNFYIENDLEISLIECLKNLTIPELKKICDIYKVPYKSNIRKGDLIVLLSENIVDKNKLTNVLVALLRENRDIIKLINKKNNDISDLSLSNIDCFKLNKLALVFVYRKEDEIVAVIPTEINDVLKEMDINDIKHKLDRYSLIAKYIKAFVNLYGIYEIDYLIEIFNKQNQDVDKLSLLEFFEVLDTYKIFNAEAIKYCNYIAHEVLFMEEGELEELLSLRQNKEYYMPSKEILLKYGNEFYLEMTKYHEDLRKYISKICKDKEMAEGIFEDICIGLNDSDIQPQNIIYEFERRGLKFNGIEEVSKLINLAMNVNNNTRKWANKGWTPSELLVEEKRYLTPLKAIGRNEPCTCGSGKKHKKCCGKN